MKTTLVVAVGLLMLNLGQAKPAPEPPCAYAGPDGSTVLAYGESFNDGCNTCWCSNGQVVGCTYMYCPHKCYIVNSDGNRGWIVQGTIIIKDAEEEGGNPQQCSCESSAPEYLGYSGLECQDI